MIWQCVHWPKRVIVDFLSKSEIVEKTFLINEVLCKNECKRKKQKYYLCGCQQCIYQTSASRLEQTVNQSCAVVSESFIFVTVFTRVRETSHAMLRTNPRLIERKVCHLITHTQKMFNSSKQRCSFVLTIPDRMEILHYCIIGNIVD